VSADHPDKLVKYCSIPSAIKMLSTQALRWSAPHLLSDPFQPDHQTQLNFDPHVLLESAIKTSTAMIFAKEPPKGNSPLLAAIRRWRDEERFADAEEADEVLKELLSQMVDQRQAQVDQMMADWRKFTRNVRVCSFASKPDNLSAWQNFADNHRGVALKFLAGENTSLPKPMPVEYKTTRPEITTLKEQLGAILNGEKVKPQTQFYNKILTKPAFNKDEQEWRCFDLSGEDLSADTSDASQWYSDTKFESAELSAVYLGAFTSSKDKRDIVDLIKKKYKQAQIFQAKPVIGKYEIEFRRITLKS